jgi:hypothetical protein
VVVKFLKFHEVHVLDEFKGPIMVLHFFLKYFSKDLERVSKFWGKYFDPSFKVLGLTH